MTLVVVTRLHNAAAAAGGMRRGLEYALAYAAERTVAGGLLADNPLHRATSAGWRSTRPARLPWPPTGSRCWAGPSTATGTPPRSCAWPRPWRS
ncbi:hypothetical protein GCM10020218_055020 [Dactylosporangium vinaceum]